MASVHQAFCVFFLQELVSSQDQVEPPSSLSCMMQEPPGAPQRRENGGATGLAGRLPDAVLSKQGRREACPACCRSLLVHPKGMKTAAQPDWLGAFLNAVQIRQSRR